MASQRGDFLSIENFKNLVHILKRFLLDKHGIEIDSTTIDLKKTLLEMMQKVDADPDNMNLTTRDVNQITLKVVKNMILKTLNSTHGNPMFRSTSPNHVQSGLARDSALYGKRPVNSTHLLPEVSSGRNDNSVMDTYEQTKQSRNPPAPRTSSEVIASYEEKPMQESEFQMRMQALQQQRESTARIPVPDSVTLSPGTTPNSRLYNEMVADMQSFETPSQMLQRNMLDANTIEKNSTKEPKDMYRPLSFDGKEDENLFIKDTINIENKGINEAEIETNPIETRILSADALKQERPYVMQERYILVNSLDRDWLQQTMRYKYKVKFNYTSQSMITVPVYENSAIVPNTRTSTTPGIPNIAGWYDNSGGFHEAYNPNSPPGDPIASMSETITLPVDNNANIQTNFKNIYSIQVTSVIIPMDINVSMPVPFGVTGGGASTNKTIFTNDYNFNFPYCLLQINEFKDVYEGTDDAIRKSFCQLVFHKSYQSSAGRGYVVLKPVQEEKKIFYPTALSTLPTLSISLLRPSGQLINESKDGMNIMKVDYDLQWNALYLRIWTHTFFDKNEFYSGDIITIKGFYIFKISPQQTTDAVNYFNGYMNRAEGHEIITLGDANAEGFYQSFFIRAPGTFNPALGKMDIHHSVTELTYFNSALGATTTTIQNGFILNTSLQNSISMRIEQKVYDSSVIGSMNV